MIRLLRRLPYSTLAIPSLAVLLSTAAPVVALAQDAAAPAASAPAPDAAPAAEAPAPDAAAPAPAAPAADASAPAPAPVAAAPSDASAPAAPSEAPAPHAAPATAVENPYGLGALWGNGDIIARAVLVILVVMSIGTWYIMITKFLEQAKLFSADRDATKHFWTKPSLQEGASALKSSSPFRYIADTGIVAADHHEGTMQESIDLTDWTSSQIHRAVDSVQSDLQSGLAFLGTVGSTSPFVGLFGTVWGIYHALTAIGIAGQASIDKVAGPVGESLIMTAIGLGTAVPAVLGYNLLVRRNKTAMERIRNFAADLQSIMIGGFRHGSVRPGKDASSPAKGA
ncbi:MotA/TolQ/ExbB proton channel family protein [Acetobacter sp.]|uniref:MotA/TolQ/ExbB proton channel family protein n=1 Tax=Acetobacter sp. TaxID=440 RepID=UPI0025BD1A8D|nr:MotA/TolQ/ExbB proton channel family protein [Acetobacter sp.]MCH4090872.1 MotA/TolQ/ExbB proton channel family protein [Acetobacter sp.]MCI1301044.1 MotA/TolQ/ExbB proton channel family protein [Acetobacter sp.]MCI1317368.1 MotA/TolQ/ExbB proton channel family protein [Acetobacter sp.]